MKVPAWSAYQEEVADFFRSIGMDCQTNVTLTGLRTSHDIDVVAEARVSGFRVLWIIECKQWKTNVPKEKVAALRQIVDEVGADRGFLVAEKGFQAGSYELARQSRVTLTSLELLALDHKWDLGYAKLQTLHQRVDKCEVRYWDISKANRIELGLRPDTFEVGYSGAAVISAVKNCANWAITRGFPLKYERVEWSLNVLLGKHAMDQWVAESISEPEVLYKVLDAELLELEQKLDRAESFLGEQK